MTPRSLLPQCGSFIVGSEVVSGVVLVAEVTDPSGQWWVGGRQVAMVQWADGSRAKMPALYRQVNRIVKAASSEGEVLKVLAADASVKVDYAPRGRA